MSPDSVDIPREPERPLAYECRFKITATSSAAAGMLASGGGESRSIKFDGFAGADLMQALSDVVREIGGLND